MFENVPMVEFIYLVLTRTPGGVTAGDSGLCCCIPRLSSAIISLYLLILFKCSFRYFVGNRTVPIIATNSHVILKAFF